VRSCKKPSEQNSPLRTLTKFTNSQIYRFTGCRFFGVGWRSGCGGEEALFNESVLHIVEFGWQEVTVTVNKTELKLVLDKLDTVKLELLRLRAMLLPEEEVSAEEKREIEAARKEIAKGSKVKLDDLVKELC
jgi:hypothetical protein